MDRTDFVSEDAWLNYQKFMKDQSSYSTDPVKPAVPQMQMASTLMDIRTASLAELQRQMERKFEELRQDVLTLTFFLSMSMVAGALVALTLTRYVSGG